MPHHVPMLIGGDRFDGDRRIEVFNPARPSELVGTIARGTPADMGKAVAAARAAQPAWGVLTFAQRAALLSQALDRTTQDIEARSALYVRENGKTLAEARSELGDVATRARHTLALAPEMDAARETAGPNGRTIVRALPYGVVLSVVPWNAPVSLGCMQIVPALLAGNAVVLKVPESCPFALMRTAELMANELPAGLLNVVSGLPSEIGDALTCHEDIAKIAFTGSIPSARHIMANAAQTIKSVTAELGGNDPAILLPDADLGEDTLRRMAGVVFRMTGQVCMAIKRFYVADAIHDHFVDAFSAVADRIMVGDGLTPGVAMGPLHTRAALQRSADLIADAQARGGSVRELGRLDNAAESSGGHFCRPHVATGVPDEARLVVEEQFCPVIPILRYHTIDEALERANASVFGLGGSVWGRDMDDAMAVAARLQAGTVFINAHGTQSIDRRAPYGGLKQSGLGRRAGIEGLHEYLQLQTLTSYEQ